jgi:hypothetical protein
MRAADLRAVRPERDEVTRDAGRSFESCPLSKHHGSADSFDVGARCSPFPGSAALSALRFLATAAGESNDFGNNQSAPWSPHLTGPEAFLGGPPRKSHSYLLAARFASQPALGFSRA